MTPIYSFGMLADRDTEREYCARAAYLWNRGSYPGGGTIWRTISDLMLAGFCLLVCSTASGQEFRPQPDPQFVVTETQPPTWIVCEPQEHANYLVMFSADYCNPCQTVKRTVLPTVEKAVGKVRVVDVQLEPQWQVRTLPTFWVCDRSSQTRIEPAIVGVCSAETLINAVKTRTKSKTVEHDDKTVTRTVTRQVPMSHADMVRLHDSLHGGGVHWIWHGDLKTHLRTVHGVDVD